MIEHLTDWREFLLEARRVLAPSGQFIVSTPNKLYYTESRGRAGANPFHVHEFDFEEFRAELSAVFPHVSLFLENHVEGVTFRPLPEGGVLETTEVRVDGGEPPPRNRISSSPSARTGRRPATPPSSTCPAANVLRERETPHRAARRRTAAERTAGSKDAQRDLADLDLAAPETDGGTGREQSVGRRARSRTGG